MAYIDAAEYNALTGRDASEATTARIMLASSMLDARIGNYPTDESTGYKLDLDLLTIAQKRAVQLWVAYMVYGLFETGDTLQTGGSLTLGRFSEGVTSNQAIGQIMPDQVKSADAVLKASGLINRHVRSRRVIPDVEAGYLL
jgi:hypothetical protein